MLKYSVIGTSWITKSFIEGANLYEDLSLDGVYSRSFEKGRAFAEETGAKRVFTDINDLAFSDTDLVYVASPNVCHYEQCKLLLLNGKHVICEKPITITADEFKELCNIAKQNNLVYFEAIMYMHTPLRQVLKDAVSKIGNIRSATIDFSQLSSKYQALKDGELPNIFNPEMKTGALNDLGIYCVYPVIDLFGMPEKITPVQHFLHTGADGSGSAAFEYSDKLVTITYSKVGQSRSASQIMGDEGTITIDSISKLDGIKFYNNAGEETILNGETDKKYLMGNEAKSAIDFILGRQGTDKFLKECQLMNEKVLLCMEKMRVENA
ncbi:MAG: Gfo/Idh/MocA family oxidoreductase [Ruminococcaceae bacterium]|nr:Gfo/Idh/MocA family oxidoreductase [Oscillospiraceae bacterium]